DVDDAPAPGLPHVRQRTANASIHAAEIDREHLVPKRIGSREQRRAPCLTSVVDEDRDSAESFSGSRECRLQGIAVGYIGNDHASFGAAVQLSCKFVERFAIAPEPSAL